MFKREYAIGYELIPDEVVNDEVDFYAHTVLKRGIADGAWQKIGKCKNVGDTENILFRMYSRDAVDHKERIWFAWYINKEKFTIGKLTKEIREKSDIGPVIPNYAIVSRITEGIIPGTIFLKEEL